MWNIFSLLCLLLNLFGNLTNIHWAPNISNLVLGTDQIPVLMEIKVWRGNLLLNIEEQLQLFFFKFWDIIDITLYTLKAYNVMIWFMYLLWNNYRIRLVNTSLTSHSYLFFLKTYPLSNFQVYNTVLITVVTMLYMRSP